MTKAAIIPPMLVMVTVVFGWAATRAAIIPPMPAMAMVEFGLVVMREETTRQMAVMLVQTAVRQQQHFYYCYERVAA